MLTMQYVLFVCIGIFLQTVSAGVADCISTFTKPTVTRRYVVTETHAYYRPGTTTYFHTTYVYPATVTTTYTSPTTTVYTATSTAFNGSTTVGDVKLITKACPLGPDFIKRCPSGYTKTVTESAVTTSIATSTKSTTISYTYTRDSVFLSETRTVTSTIVTGNPPTTTTVVETVSATTITLPPENTLTVTIVPSSIFQPTVSTATTTTIVYVSTLATPTATATVNAFSLRVTNTSINADGLTLGFAENNYAVLQNKTVVRFYIDPKQHLREVKTDRRLVITRDCETVEQVYCQNLFYFIADSEVNPQTGCSNPSNCPYFNELRCKAGCGDHIKCRAYYPAIDGGPPSYAAPFAAYLDGTLYGHYVPSFQVFNDATGGELVPVDLQAVGPVKGSL